MKTMGKFRKWLLLFVFFFIWSTLMERALIYEMYETIDGETIGNYTTDAGVNNDLRVDVISASATNVNGRMKVRVTNTSGHDIDSCYARVDLYDDKGHVAGTEYIKLEDFKNGAHKDFDITFHAKDVTGYKVAIVENEPVLPDGVVNVLGWEVDLSNIFGLNLSKFRNLFDKDGFLKGVRSTWDLSVAFAKRVPWWGYAIGAGIIAFYTPMGYMFGFIL